MAEELTQEQVEFSPRRISMNETAKSTFSPEIQELGERIVSLNLVRAAQLSRYLEEVHGIKPVANGMVLPTEPTLPGEILPEEQTAFAVLLDGLSDATRKIAVIKIVREITSIGLAEGKKLVEAAPQVIKENLPREEAEAIKKKLEDAGAKVSII